MLSVERANELFDYNPETGVVVWKISPANCVKAGDEVGSINNEGYRQTKVKRKCCKVHRLAWFLTHGVWPTAQIDHINGNRSDNRICNLREATNMENIQNLRKARSDNLSTGILGVHIDPKSGRFKGKITVCGKQIHLGYFDTAQEAHEAYLIKKREVHAFCMI